MSDEFEIKKTEYITPPPMAYDLDLIFIEKVISINPEYTDYLRWHFVVSNVAGQEVYAKAGCRVFGQTSMHPTTGNRFGKFLKALLGSGEGTKVSLEALLFGNYRVKGSVTHKPPKKAEDSPVCVIETMYDNQTTKGAGIGMHGASGKLLEKVNAWLASEGKPAIVPEGQYQAGGTPQSVPPVNPSPTLPPQATVTPSPNASGGQFEDDDIPF